MLAYEGAASSRHQSISDFTQPMNVGEAYIRANHHTGNSFLRSSLQFSEIYLIVVKPEIWN